MKTNQYLGLLLTVILLSTGILTAQVLKVNPKTSSVTIHGTSSLHEWKSKSSQLNGALVLGANNEVKSLSVSLPVKSIKSTEGGLMDSKTYDAFNADKNPNISFTMTEVNDFKVNGQSVNLACTGNLTMNGTTRKISLKSNGKIVKSGVYKFTGSVNGLNMTEYKMSPPTALMGTIKVGPAVNLSFDVTVEDQAQAAN